MTARIIFLHGASSAGKSSIARPLQDSLAEPFLHLSIDHLRDAGVLPLARIRSGSFDWATMRDAFFDGFHRSVAGFAAAGNDLIVEHIIETRDWMSRLAALLSPFDVFLVGVHCPLPELERRERARGDRRTGDARRDFETIHRHATCDLELDGTRSPEDNARLLMRAWQQRTSPSAFDRLARSSAPTPAGP